MKERIIFKVYKNVTNELAIIRFFVAHLVELPPGVQKVVDSKPAMG